MTLKRPAVPLAAAVVAIALIGLLVYGLASRGADRTLDDAVAKAQRPPAPGFSLPNLGSAGRRSLADLRGMTVVVNFWASWCVPCRAEAPLLELAQRRLGAGGAGTVLGVTFRDATPDSLKFVREFRLTYPSVRDVDGTAAKAYGTRALPETFVVDPRGRVAAISRGQLNAKFLDHAIKEAERR